jgi:hypothetical protein
VSLDFLIMFFQQTTSPSSVRTSRKDFIFFRIFEELFVFLFDFLVSSSSGSRPTLVYTRTLLVKNTPGREVSPKINTLGSLDSMVYYTPGSFFEKLF